MSVENSSKKTVIGPLAILALSVAIGLSGMGAQFADGTTINGMDVSRMTVTEAEHKLVSAADQYKLDLIFRDGSFEVDAADIDLHLNWKVSLGKMIWQQLRSEQKPQDFDIQDLYVYDGRRLKEALAGCASLQPEHMKKPENAALHYDSEADAFVLEAGDPGTVLDPSAVTQCAEEKILLLDGRLDAQKLDFYEEAVLTPDGPLSRQVLEEADELTDVDVTYLFHDAETEDVDRAFIAPLIILDEDLKPQIDQAALKKKIKKMVKKHPADEATIFFTTTDGDRIPFTYPAEDDAVNQKALLKDILKSIEKHRKGRRDVAYTGQAAENDHNFGGNYIEVDLENQMLYLYKEGEQVMSTEVVTGSTRKHSRMTPTGVYNVYNMMRNVTLKGDDYESKVSYWMPFRGGYGLHDAPWRSRFGGSIYTYNGSHGCVNMPVSKARELYETIDVGYRVVVYDAGMKESEDDED